MDYSTISNKTSCNDTEEVTNGELSERYYLLKKQYDNLSSSYDAIKQELHDTRRSYNTALDVQSHLNAELESYQADEGRRKNELSSKISSMQEEISLLREERTELLEKHSNEVTKYQEELKTLKEEKNFILRQSPVKEDTAELEGARAEIASALCDLAAAKAALEEAHTEVSSWKIRAEELVSEMAEMRVAADIRREELRAAGEREAVALADLAEARAMLHQYTDPQDAQPHAAKGNSLFAEVEDKRQEMAKNLIQMKQTNSRLRRDLANKQAELDALLHEKQTIWEQQAGASAHYDKELIESYEERVTQLEGACERQRRELARWAGRLWEQPAWLPAALHHLQTECEQLKNEVLSRGAAQLASAAQVRELRRKLALMTAAAAKSASSKAAMDDPADDKGDIVLQKFVPVKSKTVDDVRKKVSFN